MERMGKSGMTSLSLSGGIQRLFLFSYVLPSCVLGLFPFLTSARSTMAIEAIIKHGNIPETGGMLDEPDMLVQSLSIKAERDEKMFKGANKATQGVLETDPKLTFEFKAIISEYSGLCDQNPGTAVTDLANFAGSIHGFDPSDGTMIYKDPTRDLDNENPDMVSFSILHLPFVEPAVGG